MNGLICFVVFIWLSSGYIVCELVWEKPNGEHFYL